MNVEETKGRLIKLIKKINSQLEDPPFLEFHQQRIDKTHMAIKGGNGTLWINPKKKGYDIGLSGQSLENEMYDFMVNLCDSKHQGYKQTKERLPFWRVDDFWKVEKAAFRYAGLTNKLIFPDEIGNNETHIEGASQRVYVNAYERNQKARRKCIAHHGLNCKVCNFNFEDTYGSMGQNFIHVHHIKPLSKIQEEYEVDPINDLIPVCPNCHAMLHSTKQALSVEQLKSKVNKKDDHIDFLWNPIKKPNLDWLRNVPQLPLKEILTDSVYYPGCGIDFSAIANFRGIHSFVYVDNSVSYEDVISLENERSLIRSLFKIKVIRDVDITEIIKPDWTPAFEIEDYRRHHNPFCVWLSGKFHRESRPHSHMPERVSILYIGGDASEIYEALYYTHGVVPKVLGIIYPGFSAGSFDEFSLFRKVVRQHPLGVPPYLITTRDEAEMRPWDEYSENMVSLDIWSSGPSWKLGRIASERGVLKGRTKPYDYNDMSS